MYNVHVCVCVCVYFCCELQCNICLKCVFLKSSRGAVCVRVCACVCICKLIDTEVDVNLWNKRPFCSFRSSISFYFDNVGDLVEAVMISTIYHCDTTTEICEFNQSIKSIKTNLYSALRRRRIRGACWTRLGRVFTFAVRTIKQFSL